MTSNIKQTDGQLTLFNDFNVPNPSTENLKIVKASFQGSANMCWQDLFDGFDELYAITFSSGTEFINKVVQKFHHAEIIFGSEQTIKSDIAAVISLQIKCVQTIAKSKAARKLAEKVNQGLLNLFVSRDTKSHEKIFILKSDDGRTRVVTGSANMSASAFLGIQREHIICFDDVNAYEYYKDLFDDFKIKCSDHISPEVLVRTIEDKEYLKEHIDEVPLANSVLNKKVIFVEAPNADDDDTYELITDVKGFENEIKPMLPIPKKGIERVLFTSDMLKAFKREYTPHREAEEMRTRRLPKLHIDYERQMIDFNQAPLLFTGNEDAVRSDIECLTKWFDGLNGFYGDTTQCKKDYYRFLVWYLASPFMAYLRLYAQKTSYALTWFPVFAILFGQSNAGKTTFMRLLGKLMTGHEIPINSSQDFTATNINALKRGCEGVPIMIDDLAKPQYNASYEKIIKNDLWGIRECFINYPAVTITSNNIPSLAPDISKRTVAIRINVQVDKETGAKSAKKINDGFKNASTQFYALYAAEMMDKVIQMAERMKEGDVDYEPDIFKASSDTIIEIIEKFTSVPEYMSRLSYTDYFGQKVIGRDAIQQIINAWNNEPGQFKVDKKRNKLTYFYPDGGRTYELSWLKQELPPELHIEKGATSITMDLKKAEEIFDIKFRINIGLFHRFKYLGVV